MSTLTLDLAGFTADLFPADIPQACLDGARIGILDTIGVMIAGAQEEPVRIVRSITPTSTANDGAPEIPSGRNLSVADAAFVNGVAAHVLDYDDVAMDGHTSAALTPAILAQGWALGSSGQEALAAYVAGYELWALLAELEPGRLHERGFHPTATWGTLSAAAACAKLNGFDTERTAQTIAIAASLASGLVANFGTMTKSLHAGRAGQAGVLAAQLAKSGFTGSTDVLEHATGFMQAHSPSGKPDLERGDWELGTKWRMAENGINIKRYPICYATHRSIDAMLDLVSDNDLKPEDLDRIHVRTGRTQALMLRNHAPKTGLEAKFSMEFAMAAALVRRRVGLEELTDDFVRRPDVVETMRRVTVDTTEEVIPGTPFAPADEVTVALKSGATIAHDPVVDAKGSWQMRMSDDELAAKFTDCVSPRCGSEQTDRLFATLSDLPKLGSLRELPLTVME